MKKLASLAVVAALTGLVFTAAFAISPAPLTFPLNPGSVGSALPSALNANGLREFNVIDFEGSLGPSNTRLLWVADPLGSGRVVTKFVILDNDNADRYGGQRTVLGQTPATHLPGQDAWFAWGWYMGANNAITAPGDSFITPSHQATLMANYCLGTGGPAQSLILAKGADGIRDSFAFSVKTLPGTCAEGQTLYDAGPATRGKWHYFIERVTFATNGTGAVRAWARHTNPPNVFTDPPMVDVANINTLYPQYPNGEPNILLDRFDGPASDYPFVAYLWGYGRGATALEAVQNAGMCTGRATDVSFDTTGFGADTDSLSVEKRVTLRWTVPGGTCPPNLYDVRVNIVPITESNFGASFKPIFISGPGQPGPSLPGVPGSSEAMLFRACPATTYYAAVRARFGTEWGPTSNVASFTFGGVAIPDCFTLFSEQ